MNRVRFLLMLSMALFAASSANNMSDACRCNGRDGRDGKDGRDGRDGKDVCGLNNQAYQQRPSIHLDGVIDNNVDIVANTKINVWSTTTLAGHVTGGMKYHNGLITVPTDGVYFVYCQVYYNGPAKGKRHRIYVNEQAVALAASHVSSAFTGTLYTGLTVKLNAKDKLSCRLQYNSRVYTGPYHSFFGAFVH